VALTYVHEALVDVVSQVFRYLWRNIKSHVYLFLPVSMRSWLMAASTGRS
jgi:hypothetical protein